MRLYEIEKPKFVQVQKNTTAPTNSQYSQGGLFSVGKAGDDPHEYEVKSRNFVNPLDDGKYQWIKISRYFMNKNPYIPIYYNVEITKNAEGKHKLKSQMQSYRPITDLSPRELASIAAKIFNDPIYLDKSGGISVKELIAEIRMLSDKIRNNETINDDIDPYLLQTLKIINHVTKKNLGLYPDLHSGNIMTYFTGKNWQLVFTDPIA